jgi:hypothetical protein
MPIRRFRDAADMPGPPRHDPSDPALWSRIAGWMALSKRLSPRSFPPGVFKNRTMEEANRRREDWRARERQKT